MQARSRAKQVLAQGDRVIRPKAGVTVLIYHRVGGGADSEVDLDPNAFRAQLEHLSTHHRVLDLDSAATASTTSLPKPPADCDWKANFGI